jgi:hypothetical protein
MDQRKGALTNAKNIIREEREVTDPGVSRMLSEKGGAASTQLGSDSEDSDEYEYIE